MNILKLIYVLYKIKLLSLTKLHNLFAVIYKQGINVFALLNFAERIYANNIALVDEQETINYQQLFSQTERLAFILANKYQLKSGQKVVFLCKNHAALVKAIFAVSRIGVDIYFLNTEMSKQQIKQLLEQHDFDLLIYDVEFSPLLEHAKYTKAKLLSYHDTLPAINDLLTSTLTPNLNHHENHNLKRNSKSKLMLLTGGTTGNSKVVTHKPSLFNYLSPFLGLITRLNLLRYSTVYIATPIYHGYGIAVLFLFLALGKKVVLSNGFEARKACSLIRQHQVEVVTVVPLMLHKMLHHNAEDLKTLACIASGGAELNPKLVGRVFNTLGPVLYNLYGTSESGLNIIATPEDLHYAANTIGRKISGVHLKVLDNHKQTVNIGSIGQFCIKTKWSMLSSKTSWIETGDLGYRDSKGYYFLSGRRDDLVVSAGENVYPLELEQIFIHHPLIEDVAVIGINDEQFGQRLKAFVQLRENAQLNKEQLYEWVRPRVARFQTPKELVFVKQLPYTPLGKLDKKQLKHWDSNSSS